MRVANNKYKSLDELQQGLNLSALNPENTLVQVFCGLIDESEIKQVQSIFKEKRDDISFIGTTTAGEINNGEISESSIVVSVIEFESTSVQYASFSHDDDFKLGIDIASKLFSKNTKAVALFIDGLFTNGDSVVDGISSVNSTVPIAGGMAGDNGNYVTTFVFDNNGVYAKGCVGAALNSDVLEVFTDYQLNWQAIGQTMTVTKAVKNRLYEIDGINASEIYRKYLGKKVGENLPFSATEFPLLKIEDDGLEICRTFIRQFDDGSLLTIGNLGVGDKVRLAFGNIDLVLNSTKNNVRKYADFQPEAIFAYSCTARRAFLQSEIVAELRPLSNIAPTCGFFTYGEIYHNNNKNSLLNITLTIFALSENKIDSRRNRVTDSNEVQEFEKNFITNKHFLVLDALTNLSNTVIEELNESNRRLEEAQEKLKEQANRDYLTNLYNRRYFNEIAQNFMKIAKRERKQFSVIMLDIDNFKSINDSYGHAVGDEVIKELASSLLEHTRESDAIARFGGEEFAILLPFTDRKGAYEMAEELRGVVENKKIKIDGNEYVQFTISLGVACIDNEKDTSVSNSLNRADNALYEAKEAGKNRVVVN